MAGKFVLSCRPICRTVGPVLGRAYVVRIGLWKFFEKDLFRAQDRSSKEKRFSGVVMEFHAPNYRRLCMPEDK